ncbi:hypothetical protein Bca4012_058713 [Brassica carinata]
MWVLVFRSACVAKKYELWFVVNGVRIRYSLRELGLISGLYCHEYPLNHERLGCTIFMNKYFGGKRVTYADLEKQMLAMKSKPSEDRKKMAALYFLASILLLAFEAIPSLRNHFRENMSGARIGCPRMCNMQYKRKSGTKEFSLNVVNDKLNNNTKSILVATAIEKELLASIGMDKESCWADDADDAAVDRWTKIIRKGKKQIFFEEQFAIDFESRTSRIAHADSVEATGATPGAVGFKAMECRLMNAVRDAMKEVNEKVTSLSQKLALLEEEVKSLRLSGPGMSCDDPSDQDAVSDNPADQDDSSDNNESKEEDGSDNKESEEENGGLIRNITDQIQRVHGDGDVVMDDDDDAEMYAHALEVERNLEEKAKTVETKKKRSREDDGKEAVPAKKSKGCERVRSPVYARRLKAAEEEAAPKKAAAKKTAAKKASAEKEAYKKAAAEKTAATKAAEEDAAQKKQKKPKRKKVGKL